MSFVTPEELKAKIASNKNTIVIDVCEPYEYQNQHIEGAINIPLTGLQFNFKNILPEVKNDDEIIVYCAHGFRSQSAMNMLRAMNFDNVKSLEGGIANWYDRGMA